MHLAAYLASRKVHRVHVRIGVSAAQELTAPAYVNHDAPPGVPPNREGIKQLTAMFRQAFPDGRMAIEDMVAEADRVATRKTFSGTHRGEFMGIPPTGRTFAIRLMDIARLADGKVVERWYVGDDLGLLQQLGALQLRDSADR